VLTVVIALITGFVGLIAALPNVQAIASAKLVGKTIFDVIDRVPKIRDVEGAVSNYELENCIQFTNVSFRYPTAQADQRNIFDCVSFTIPAGESTAIVGPSGFGKSTIVQMIERFYDPSENKGANVQGQISFDGRDIRSIKLKTLRESIGYVPQEPTLIIGTIRENLQFGNRDATDAEIEKALIQANA
jgi:ABC-type multidrug transport system fused ATPase/permease subunit